MGAAARAKAATWDSASITERWLEIFEDAVRRHGPGPGRSAILAPGRGDDPADPPGRRAPGSRGRRRHPRAGAHRAPRGRHRPSPRRSRRRLVRGAAAARPAGHRRAADGRPRGLRPRRSRRRPPCPTTSRSTTPSTAAGPAGAALPTEMVAPLLRGRTGRLLLEPWPLVDHAEAVEGLAGTLLGRGCEVAVEFWETGADGDLHAPGRPAWTTSVPRDAATTTTRVHDVEVPTLAVMAGPTVYDVRFPIDVVYTWVDGSDEAWEAARAARLAAVGRPDDADPCLQRARALRRPRRAALLAAVAAPVRALGAHDPPRDRRPGAVVARPLAPADQPGRPPRPAPGRRAADLQLPRHRVGAAPHRRPGRALRLPQRRLLRRRPGPARAVLRPVGLGRGLPVLDGGRAAGPGARCPGPAPPPTTAACSTTPSARRRSTPSSTRRTPTASRCCSEIATRFADEVDATTRAPFRSATDVSMLSSLAQHYGLLTGAAHVGEADYAFVDITETVVRRRLKDLAPPRPRRLLPRRPARLRPRPRAGRRDGGDLPRDLLPDRRPLGAHLTHARRRSRRSR